MACLNLVVMTLILVIKHTWADRDDRVLEHLEHITSLLEDMKIWTQGSLSLTSRLERLLIDAEEKICDGNTGKTGTDFDALRKTLILVKPSVEYLGRRVDAVVGKVTLIQESFQSCQPESTSSSNREVLQAIQHLEQKLKTLIKDSGTTGDSETSIDVRSNLRNFQESIGQKISASATSQQENMRNLVNILGDRIEQHIQVQRPVIIGESVSQLVQEKFNIGLDTYSEKVEHILDQKIYNLVSILRSIINNQCPLGVPDTSQYDDVSYNHQQAPMPLRQTPSPGRQPTHQEQKSPATATRKYSSHGVDIVGPPQVKTKEKVEVGSRLTGWEADRSYLVHRPKHCADIRQLGWKDNGIYEVYLLGPYTQPMAVYCDMVTSGGGWTVIQRRNYLLQPYINFDRTWSDYRLGFGDLNGEFWLGNENIHYLTNSDRNVLHVNVVNHQGNSLYAEYNGFKIAGERYKYMLRIGRFLGGTLADEFSSHNGSQFSTPEEDNDSHPGRNCAETYYNGWWYDTCFRVNLNGLHVYPLDSKAIQGMYWGFRFPGQQRLRASEMKLRPLHFTATP